MWVVAMWHSATLNSLQLPGNNIIAVQLLIHVYTCITHMPAYQGINTHVHVRTYLEFCSSYRIWMEEGKWQVKDSVGSVCEYY